METKRESPAGGNPRGPSENDSAVQNHHISGANVADAAARINHHEELLRCAGIFDFMRREAKIPSDDDSWVAAEFDLLEAALTYASTTRARVQ